MTPRELWLGAARTPLMRLCPLGAHLAALEMVEGVARLQVCRVEDAAGHSATGAVQGVPLFDAAAPEGVKQLEWSPDGGYLVAVFDASGDDRLGLRILSLATDAWTTYRPTDRTLVRLERFGKSNPHALALWVSSAGRGWPVVVQLDLRTLDEQVILDAPNVRAAVFDGALRPRVLGMVNQDGGMSLMAAPDASVAASTIEPLHIPLEHDQTTQLIGLDARGDVLHLLGSMAGDTSALCRWDLGSGVLDVLAQDERFDLLEALCDPATGQPQAIAVIRDSRHWRGLDEAISADLDGLASSLGTGDYRVIDRCRGDGLWLIQAHPGQARAHWALYSRARRSADILRAVSPRRSAARLPRTEAFWVSTADGLDIQCFMSLPHTPAPAQGFPVVVHVHGGPWKRDHAHEEPLHWWLPDAGFAVLGVNFRGSLGYGARFLNAGNREWGGRMLDDVWHALEQACTRYPLDRQRVAVMGRSFGGHAALMAAARWPGAVRCVVSIYGPTRLRELLQAMPAEWTPTHASVARRVGEWWTPEGQADLDARSPLALADRIQCPVLLVHGDRDRRVPLAQSADMAERLDGLGVPVSFIKVPGEGHGLRDDEARLAVHAAIEVFLSAHLASRVHAPISSTAARKLEFIIDKGCEPPILESLQ